MYLVNYQWRMRGFFNYNEDLEYIVTSRQELIHKIEKHIRDREYNEYHLVSLHITYLEREDVIPLQET